MTDDLSARLLAAIEQREKLARAATEGPWAAIQQYEDGPVGVDVVPPDRTGTYIVCPDLGAGMIAEDAEHIAHNAPDAVLRRCAADRKILTEILPDIQHADVNIECEWGSNDDCAARLLTALAEGYGITEETT